MQNQATNLLLIFKDLDWDSYVRISNEVVKIDEENIERELAVQASNFSYYSGLWAIAKKELDKAQLELTQFMATARKTEQEEALATGRKATDKSLEAHVTSLPRYTELNGEVISARFKFDLLRNLVAALEQKASMVQQISANSRAETKLYNI